MNIRWFGTVVLACLSSMLSFATLAQDYQLTVVGGAGSGSYPAGTRVFIAANPYDTPDAQRATWEPVNDASAGVSSFTAWLGQISGLDESRSPETWITMPASDVVVLATFSQSERWAPPVLWQEIPPKPLGVIFLLHGGSGSTASMAAKTESGVFAQQAVARGYGVVFFESFERKDGQFNWDKNPNPEENYDLQRVAAVRTGLIQREEITVNTPVFLAGVSGGGQFASLFVEDTQLVLDLPVAGQVLIVSAGDPLIMRQTTTPTLFLIGDNDRGVRQPALNSYQDLQQRGIPTQLRNNREIPVHPERFWRIQGLNRADSLAIHGALRADDILDADNFLVDRPKNLDWEASIPANYRSFLRAIEDQLFIVYGGHRQMSNLNYVIFDFLDGLLP